MRRAAKAALLFVTISALLALRLYACSGELERRARERGDPQGTRVPFPARRNREAEKFSLFLSFAPPSPHFGNHHNEIMAAIRANLLVGPFCEVVVWYEEDMEGGWSCVALLEVLLTGFPELEAAGARERLRCWPRLGGQPTYGEMFRMVQESARQLRSQAVVLANADMVFGPTLLTLYPIKPRQLHTLSLNGAVAHASALYCSTIGRAAGCYACDNLKPKYFDCNIDRTSGIRRQTIYTWDGYVFNTTSFQQGIDIVASRMPYFMNKMMAESHATCALHRMGFSPDNSCSTVRVIGFHCARKTHDDQPGTALSTPNSVDCKTGDFEFGGFFWRQAHERRRTLLPIWVLDPTAVSML